MIIQKIKIKFYLFVYYSSFFQKISGISKNGRPTKIWYHESKKKNNHTKYTTTGTVL